MRKARQAIHSDTRINITDMHERIVQEMDNTDLTEYLLQVTPLLKKLQDESISRKLINTEYVKMLRENEYNITEETKNVIKSASALLEKDLLTERVRNINNLSDETRCPMCEETVEIIDNGKDDHGICPSCGYVNTDLLTRPRLLKKGEIYLYSSHSQLLSTFAYKRVNHFREWLNQFQGREACDISDVVKLVKIELKKERFTNTITYAKIRKMLKKLHLGKFYEHVVRIHAAVTCQEPPQLSSELEGRLVEMFQNLQSPFEKHSPKSRKNFLSYSYTLNKLCGILELKHMQKFFPLLKSRERLFFQDQIWQKICTDMSWKYEASL